MEVAVGETVKVPLVALCVDGSLAKVQYVALTEPHVSVADWPRSIEESAGRRVAVGMSPTVTVAVCTPEDTPSELTHSIVYVFTPEVAGVTTSVCVPVAEALEPDHSPPAVHDVALLVTQVIVAEFPTGIGVAGVEMVTAGGGG